MACPALPLCGLAVTEAERSLPDMLPRLRSLLNRLGLEDLDALVVRMTGALVFQLGEAVVCFIAWMTWLRLLCARLVRWQPSQQGAPSSCVATMVGIF